MWWYFYLFHMGGNNFEIYRQEAAEVGRYRNGRSCHSPMRKLLPFSVRLLYCVCVEKSAALAARAEVEVWCCPLSCR